MVIQKTVRMYLAKKKHRPRIQGLNRIAKLNVQVKSLEQTAQKMKKDKEAGQADVRKLQADLATGITKIRVNTNHNHNSPVFTNYKVYTLFILLKRHVMLISDD